jgi:putative transposase
MKVRRKVNHRKGIRWLLEQDMEVKLEVLKHQLDLSRMLINELFEEEVKDYTGAWYSHQKPHAGRYSRWGFNPGSVKLGSERIRLDIPRIYDHERESNPSLGMYHRLKELPAIDERLLKAVLLGLSTRDYEQVIKTMLDSFGLSHSSISHEFIEQSSRQLEAFESRDLSEYEFIGLFIDGKYLSKEQMIIVLGVTLKGDKIPLGFIQSATENAKSIKELLSKLVERGLGYDDGLLCVIDGSKGIYKAVKEVFDRSALVQRCLWHKRENVLSYLNEIEQEHYKRRLNKAYGCDNYQEAKDQLQSIIRDLKEVNLSASRSLQEGLEETLTLHRLDITDLFRRSFSTTNCIENLNSQLGKYLKKVKHWKTSDQRYRWIACGLLESEQRMRKIHNYKKLYLLKEKIKKEIKNEDELLKEVA